MREDNQVTDRLFEEPLATILADKREEAREKGRRLVYDCRNNQVIPGHRVKCGHGCLPRVRGLLRVGGELDERPKHFLADFRCAERVR